MSISPLRRALGALLFVSLANAPAAQVADGIHTFGIELDGTVCGYAEFQTSTVKGEDGAYTLVKHEVLMLRSALGSDFTTELDLTYHVDQATGRFTYHDSHIVSGDIELESKVTVEGNVARFTSTLAADETTIEIPHGALLENTLYFPHLLRDFVQGDAKEMTYSLLEVREWEMEEVVVTRVQAETLELSAGRFETVVLDRYSPSSGVKVRVWLDTKTGIIVKSDLPGGYVSTLATPAVKKLVKRVNIDDTIVTKTNVAIADITGISYLKVKAVLEPSGLQLRPEDLNVPGQKFVGTVVDNLVDGVFEIEIPHYDGTNAPPFPPVYYDETLREYLEPDEFMESEDPVLVKKAQEITEGAKDSWDAAVRLSLWVADNIGYVIPGGLTARRTYDLGEGECGAHSILLGGFCRAVGIPARVVWGCMYLPNAGGSFGQHAWTEIWMGEAGWVPVDSTAHEVDFVDSAHLRIGLLDSLAIALNAKSFEILEYRVASGEGEGEVAADVAAKLAPYVGDYLAPDASLLIPALVRDGRLAVDIRGQVLALNEPDEKGRWFCTLSNRLYFVFGRDTGGEVDTMTIHEIARIGRTADPEEIGDDVPADIVPLLGKYTFPQAKLELTVFWNEGLMVHNALELRVVRFDLTDEEGRWLDEFGKNSMTFEADDEGKVRALFLDVASEFARQ